MGVEEVQLIPRTILDCLSDGLILLDSRRYITEINSAALRMLDTDRKLAIAVPIGQFIDLPPALFDPTDILPHLHVPLKIQHKSGLDLEIELTLHPTPSGWLLVLRKTIQNHQIDQLKENQKVLETALANTPDILILLDQNHRLLYTNDPTIRLKSLPVTEWTSFNWQILGVSWNDKQRLDDLLNEALTTGNAINEELKIENEQGQFHYKVMLKPVKADLRSDLMIVATFSDITQHLRHGGTLRESREFYRRIFTNTPEPILITDTHGLVTEASPSFIDLFKIKAEKDAIGLPVSSLFAPKDADQAQKNLDLILNGFSSLVDQDTLFSLQRQDGGQFIGEIKARVYQVSNGQPGGLVVTIRDASQREKERVELNHANKLLVQTNRELENHNFMVTNLNEMGQALLACDSVDSACQVLANTTAKLFTGQAGSIFLKGPHSDLLKLTSAWGENPYLENDIDEHTCTAIQSKSTRFFCVPPLNKDLIHQNRALASQVEGPQVCFPLIVQDEVIGIFQLHGKPLEIHDTWIQIAGSMADKFAMTIANLRLRDSLRSQAIRDPLTGLYNRRYMEESLNRELSRAKRHNHPVGIIMMDIDFFKAFNDTYLHDGGDALLRRLGRFYRSHTRGEDITCRYGGEEFLLILPETTLTESFDRAEAMRKQIGQIRLVHHGVQLGRITISAGVSCFPNHGQGGDELLRAADTALYISKNSGRNRSTLAANPDD